MAKHKPNCNHNHTPDSTFNCGCSCVPDAHVPKGEVPCDHMSLIRSLGKNICENCGKEISVPTMAEHKHEWIGEKWQPQTQRCKFCEISWREWAHKTDSAEKAPAEWEEEFDKWINQNAFSTVIPAKGINCGDAEEIKSFISSLLLEAEKAGRASLAKEIEEKITELRHKATSGDHYDLEYTYALSDLLTFINSIIENK